MTESISQSDLLAMLTGFNLTRQEAMVYIGLITEGEMNGYEVAKQLGISRSNAYTALRGLVDKGAAWVIEESTTRYTAVPPDEFCSNHLHRLSTIKEQLLANLPKQRSKGGAYITVQGKDHILDRLRHLIGETQKRIYLALPGTLINLIVDPLTAVRNAGCKVVIITDTTTANRLHSKKTLLGATIYSGKVSKEQIRVIVDSEYVLTGDLTGGSHASCLYSNQKNLVDIFKSALRNEIKLIEMAS